MVGDHYVVALSRQIYTYGVAFQLTGELKYLDYAKAGVDYLRQNALDRETGGAFSWWDAKAQIWGPALDYRNPQEQAYALMGMAYYYYLTRDTEILQDILDLKDFIFETYYNPELGLLQWQLKDGEDDKALDQRLVAQLDQLNAYMLLLAPILPEPQKTEWIQDMVWLSEIMLDNFYSASENLFFLSAVAPNRQANLTTEIDFGHTIKTMWLMRMIGMLSNEPSLVDFAVENAPKVLEQAFIAELGAWAEGVQVDGTVNRNASWWVYAELDQFTASFALQNPAMMTYLAQTYNYWFDYFVDPQFGEVWTGIDASTQEPMGTMPKQWPWKNGYHSFEHALVGYITSSQLHDEPIVLHYAFEQLPELDTIHPYYYRGDIDQITLIPGKDKPTVYTVTFSDVY
ncbi:MAG: AGE family epimerase/isomerase [Cyanobacteria bacterium P01_C01_bin.118]